MRKDSTTWSKAHATCVTPGVETSIERLRSRPDGGADLVAVRRLARRRAEVVAEELVGAVDEMDLHRAAGRAPNLCTARSCALAASTSRSFGAATVTSPARSVAETPV